MRNPFDMLKVPAAAILLALLLCAAPAFASEGGHGGGDSGGSDGASGESSFGQTRDPISGSVVFGDREPLDLAAETIQRIMSEGSDGESTRACRATSR